MYVLHKAAYWRWMEYWIGLLMFQSLVHCYLPVYLNSQRSCVLRIFFLLFLFIKSHSVKKMPTQSNALFSSFVGMLCLCPPRPLLHPPSLWRQSSTVNTGWPGWSQKEHQVSFTSSWDVDEIPMPRLPNIHVSVQACIRTGDIELSHNKKKRILVFYCLLRVQPASRQPHHSQSRESEIAWHNRRRGATCHSTLSGVKGDWPEGIEMGITHSATFFVRSYVTCTFHFSGGGRGFVYQYMNSHKGGQRHTHHLFNGTMPSW